MDLARDGAYRVQGLDISHTFVEIARTNARAAGVEVQFMQGDASAMPFGDGSFDVVICCAAFKNITYPVEMLRELHRVLKPGGTACIIDLRRDVNRTEVDAYIREMGLSWFNSWMTRKTFKSFLLKNAYTGDEMRALVKQTAFPDCRIVHDGISIEVWLTREQV